MATYKQNWSDAGRTCTACRQHRPWDEFSPRKAGRNGRNSRCRPCQAGHKASRRAARPDAREREREYESRPDVAERIRVNKIANRYNLSAEEYRAKIEAQGGRCALCPRVPKLLRVDHDHGTGLVRDLLCASCNNALGMAGDDPTRLRAMADYIERHAKKAAS